MKLTKAQRETVRAKFGGRCAYCGYEIPDKFHADHVEAIYRGYAENKPLKPELDTIENMFPSCAPCNIDKSVWSVEQWRVQLQGKLEVLKRNSSPYRHALRFGLVFESKEPVVFWFEKYDQHVFDSRK